MERLGMGAGGGFGGPAGLGGAGVPPVADPEAAFATQPEQLQGARTIIGLGQAVPDRESGV